MPEHADKQLIFVSSQVVIAIGGNCTSKAKEHFGNPKAMSNPPAHSISPWQVILLERLMIFRNLFPFLFFSKPQDRTMHKNFTAGGDNRPKRKDLSHSPDCK